MSNIDDLIPMTYICTIEDKIENGISIPNKRTKQMKDVSFVLGKCEGDVISHARARKFKFFQLLLWNTRIGVQAIRDSSSDAKHRI